MTVTYNPDKYTYVAIIAARTNGTALGPDSLLNSFFVLVSFNIFLFSGHV